MCPECQQWRGRRSAKRMLVTLFILPTSRCYCAPNLVEENGTHTLSIEFSTHTEILASPANASCSVAHQLQEKLSGVRSLAEQHTHEPNPFGSQGATCPKSGQGAYHLKSHTNTTKDDFSTQPRNKPRNVSGDHSE